MREKRNWIKRPPHCRTCWNEGCLVTGRELYPHRRDLYDKKFWLCDNCQAYVGTHKRSATHAPLGLMATEPHRQLKSEAHRLFDPLWKEGSMTRDEAYKWLSKKMDSERQVHIGWSTIEELNKIIFYCKEWREGFPCVNCGTGNFDQDGCAHTDCVEK